MSGYIAPFYFQQFRLANGLPNSGGSITTYSNQTSTPKAIYYDITLQNACPNPLSLDSAGYAPEFYLGEGLYTFVIKDSNGNIIVTRDWIAGSVSSVDLSNISATSAAYKIKIDENDNTPGYIWNKLSATNTISFTNNGDTIAANVINPWKVKASGSDNTPGYISDKIGSTSTIELSVSAEKLYAEYIGQNIVQITSEDIAPGYLEDKLIDSDTITWAISGDALQGSVPDIGKALISSGDILGYIEDKIRPGSGIVFTQTEDVNGKQIHISTTNSTTNSGKVKVTSGDSLEYLADKFIAGPGISISADTNNIAISNTNSTNGYLSVVRTALDPWNFGTDIGFQNAISATVSAGTWEIGGTANVAMVLSGSLPTRAIAAISTTAYSQPDDGYESYAEKNQDDSPMTLICFPKRFTFTTATVVYLVVYSYGTYSNGRIWGNISCRQVS